MTDPTASPNAFEQDKPGTNARVQAEAAIERLREGGGFFVDAVRATRMPMALTDPTLPGNPIIFANQSFLALSGYSMDEVLGQQPYFMNGPDTDPKDAERFRRILEDDQDGVVETVQYAKSGRRFVATVLLSAFKDEDGRTIHHFLSWLDVTRRVDAEDDAARLRETQAALRQSEERLRGVLNSIAEGFAHFDADFTILDVNDETLRLDGRSRGQLIGRSHWEAFPGSEHSEVGNLFRRVMRDRTPGSLEHSYRWPDGREAWLDVRAYPTPDGGVACLWRDVTEYKMSEAALREGEARRRLLQTAWDADADGVVIADSPSWRAFTGQSLEEWLGYGWLDAVHPDDRVLAEQQWREAVATRGLVDAEFRIRAPGGGWRWTNVRAAPVLGPGGRIEKWTGMNIDIDARKNAEAALREREERQAFMLTLGDAIRAEASANVQIEIAARQIGERLKASQVLYAEFDEVKGIVQIFNGWFDDGARPFNFVRQLTDHDGPILDSLRAGQTVRIDDVEPFTDQPAFADVAALGIGSILSVPMIVGGRLAVTLSVHQHSPRHWTDDEVALVEEAAERLWAEVVRARAETALRESEGRLSLAIEVGQFASWDWDLRTADIAWNDRHYIMQGYAVGEVTPSFQAWIARVQPDDRTETVARIELARDTKTPYQHEFRNLLPDGTVRWVAARGRFFYDEAGQPYRMIGIMEDVTERRSAEAALRESEERFRGFGENSSDALWIVNAESGRLEYLSPAFERIWGVGRDKIKDDTARWAEMIHPDDLASAMQAMPRMLAGEPFVAEYRIVRPDGEVRWIRDTGFPIAENGEVKRGGGIAQDVTELKRSEERLRATEERLQRFGEASQDILWIRDAETLQWVYLTPAFETIYGLSREEALSGDNYRSWLDLLVPEDREHAERSIGRVRAGEQVAFDYRICRPCDGAIRWLRNTDFPITDASGKVVLIGGIGHDLTELRESGQRAKLLLAELQHRVRNIMAMLRSVAQRTAGSADTVENYVQHLEGRISAMARTQALLTRDIDAAVDLESLILDELEMQAAQASHYRITGPDVSLPPKAAEVLGLAIHELATNSVKYGALSQEGALVDVRWALLEGEGLPQLSLIWTETGVEVDRKPERSGFGTELITQRVPYELNGTGTMEFDASGLVATIEFPLANRASILQTDEGR